MEEGKERVCDRECRMCVDNLVEDLKSMSDGRERLEYLVEIAKALPCLHDEFKRDCFKVQGCISNLWIVPEIKEGKCYFHCDGDAVIPKAVAFIITALHSGYTPEEILNLDMSKLKELGLDKLLSPNRRNAVSRVPETIRAYARRFLEEHSCSGCNQPLRCLISAQQGELVHIKSNQPPQKIKASPAPTPQD